MCFERLECQWKGHWLARKATRFNLKTIKKLKISKESDSMALDGYSLCPGGRNKKIRFCCPDKLKDIEKVHDLVAHQQFKAAITLIEGLEKKYNDHCACLTAMKLMAMRCTSDWDNFITVAEDFYAREPQNGTAISELAIGRAATGRAEDSVSLLVDGFELPEEGKALNAVVMSAHFISQLFCQTGNPIIGLALAKVIPACMPDSEEITLLLRRLIQETQLPAAIKGLRFNPYAPSDFPEKKEYDSIAPLIAVGRWKTAKKKLDALVPLADKWHGILFSQALLQLWLGQTQNAIETLRKYADMPGLSEEDQADALALVYMLNIYELHDTVNIVCWEITLNHFESAQERLLSNPQLYSLDFDPRRYGNADTPPPRNAFMILDRPFAPDDVPPAIDNIPRQIGTAFLFGKQTDRDARIEIFETLEINADKINSLLTDTLQETLGEIKELKPQREKSLILAQLDGRLRFKNSNPPTQKQVQQILSAYFGEKGIFQMWWLNQPFAELDGKTPQQAVSDTKYKPRLLGMIQLIEFSISKPHALETANILRRMLGFSELGEIILPEKDAELALSKLPVTRWFRVDTKPLPSESLAGELALLDLISEERGSLHFANEVLARPLREIDPGIRGLAFHILIENAELNNDYETAILWIDRARNEAMEIGNSLAEWDVAELMVRVRQGNDYEATRMINHIMTHHKNDTHAMSVLQSLFVQMGLLHPDGSPTPLAFQRRRTPVDLTASAPNPSVSPSPILSPDNPAPQPPPSGGSKLWVPD